MGPAAARSTEPSAVIAPLTWIAPSLVTRTLPPDNWLIPAISKSPRLWTTTLPPSLVTTRTPIRLSAPRSIPPALSAVRADPRSGRRRVPAMSPPAVKATVSAVATAPLISIFTVVGHPHVAAGNWMSSGNFQITEIADLDVAAVVGYEDGADLVGSAKSRPPAL